MHDYATAKKYLRVNLFQNPPREGHPTHSNTNARIEERVTIEPGVYRATLWNNEKYVSFTLEEKIGGAPTETAAPAAREGGDIDDSIPF